MCVSLVAECGQAGIELRPRGIHLGLQRADVLLQLRIALLETRRQVSLLDPGTLGSLKRRLQFSAPLLKLSLMSFQLFALVDELRSLALQCRGLGGE